MSRFGGKVGVLGFCKLNKHLISMIKPLTPGRFMWIWNADLQTRNNCYGQWNIRLIIQIKLISVLTAAYLCVCGGLVYRSSHFPTVMLRRVSYWGRLVVKGVGDMPKHTSPLPQVNVLIKERAFQFPRSRDQRHGNDVAGSIRNVSDRSQHRTTLTCSTFHFNRGLRML